jgi:hypothetical protein
MATTKNAKVEPVDMKLEVVLLGVSDVDCANKVLRSAIWRNAWTSLEFS